MEGRCSQISTKRCILGCDLTPVKLPVKMVLTLAIYRQLIALKGLRKVFEIREKKYLKVFEYFWSWRLRTLFNEDLLAQPWEQIVLESDTDSM